jgi:hypothetical protein
MPHSNFATVRSRLVPVAALLAATALGGCIAYSGYPSGYYGSNYPSGYYGGNRPAYAYPAYNAGYPSTYTNSYNQRPLYSPDYNSSFNTYENSGGGR